MSDDKVIKGDLICFGRNEAEGLVMLDLGTVSVREGEKVKLTYSDFLTEDINETKAAITRIEELEQQIKEIYNTISERSYERK